MENLGLGLELMLIGMASVFVILIIVILLGKLTISVTNRFPQQQDVPRKVQDSSVSPKVSRIISEAVRELTGGKGTVKEIVKL